MFALSLVVVSFIGAGCETHATPTAHRCPSPATTKLVVASERGAVGLAKIGFTPRALKAIEKCD
jgi:hypothetical protein